MIDFYLHFKVRREYLNLCSHGGLYNYYRLLGLEQQVNRQWEERITMRWSSYTLATIGIGNKKWLYLLLPMML